MFYKMVVYSVYCCRKIIKYVITVSYIDGRVIRTCSREWEVVGASREWEVVGASREWEVVGASREWEVAGTS